MHVVSVHASFFRASSFECRAGAAPRLSGGQEEESFEEKSRTGAESEPELFEL